MILKLEKNSQGRYGLSGTHFRVIESVCPVSVSFVGGDRDQTVTLERGMSFEPVGGFEYVLIESQESQEVDIQVTLGALDDNRMSGEVTVVEKIKSGLHIHNVVLQDRVDVVVNKSSSRLKLTLRNSGKNEIKIGSQSDLVANSYVLGVGESIVFSESASAVIYALSELGSVIDVIEEFESYEYQELTDYLQDDNLEPILDEYGNVIY